MCLIIQTLQILAGAGSLSLSNQIDLPLALERLVYDGGSFSFSDHKVIKVKGPDAGSFLNNQTTNNVLSLEKDRFQLDALLDLSAKLVGFFHVLRAQEDEFLLLVNQQLCNSTVERLEKYLIAEDVEISIVEKTFYGVLGTASLSRFSEGFRGAYAGEECLLVASDPGLPSFDDSQELKLLRISTGYPVWGETLLSLELINNTTLVDMAYDKSKGCFLGQETVAKIETRRGAAYKPVILKFETEFSIEPGSDLFCGGKKIGKFISQSSGYALASLARASRIELLKIQCDEIGEGAVYNLPLYKASDKASSYYHRGIDLFQEGDEEGAEKYILMAIDVDPLLEDAYESLGVLYGRQERFKEAIDYMEKLSKLNAKSVMAHTNMSLYYMKIGEIEKAEEQKSQATIKQFQQLGDEADTKRRLEEEKKKNQEELKKREGMYLQVLEIDPEDTLANYGLGEIELQKGKYQEAISHLTKAIEHKKNYSVAWLALGKAYQASGDLDHAKETLRQGIEIAGKNGDLMPANEMQRILSEIN